MSVPVKLDDNIKISSSEISKWLKKAHLSNTPVNITTATNALRVQKQQDSIPIGRDISFTATDASRDAVYGFARKGGTITFLDSRNNNQNLDVVITVAGHEINGIQKLYIDDCTVIFETGNDGWASAFQKPDGSLITQAYHKLYFKVATGADDQAAIAALVANNPRWTASHKQSGCAHVYIMLVWDGFLFGDGLPNFEFLVEGKKVYDPLTDTTYFSNLSALCAADVIMNSRFGLGTPTANVDLDPDADHEGGLGTAAVCCGEDVALLAGGTEKRYTVNGYFSMDQPPGRILEQMAASMGGNITYTNGIWKFWPAKWRAPTLNFTVDDLRGAITNQVLVSRDDIFNSVRGRFVSAANGYNETDFSPVWNDSYRAVDGATIWQNIDQTMVTSEATCQRLGKIEIERIRQGMQFEVPVSLKGLKVQVPEVVTFTIERYGWDEKPFEVIRAVLSAQATNGANPPEMIVTLTLRETGSGVYNWNYWEQTLGDIAPNTNLPNAFSVPILTGMTLSSGTADLYKRGDGTIAPRIKVTWTAIADFFVSSGGKVEIQFKPTSSGTWLDATAVPGSSSTMYIADVQDGIYYDVRGRCVNTFGIASDWTTVSMHFVVGKTAPPADVVTFAGVVSDYGITLGWGKVNDFDLKEYEIREGTTWTSSQFIARTASTQFNLNVRAAGTYNFMVKAVDTSGNYSTNPASATVVVVGPGLTTVDATFEGDSLKIDWPEASLGSWAIDTYNVYYGDIFSTATFLVQSKASVAKTLVTWNGNRRFWVVARDIYGNTSTPIFVDVLVNGPNAVSSFSATVIDNNVLAKWEEPAASSLPIVKYVLKKGDVYGSADTIGEMFGTFTVIFELLSGHYTYWIEAVDTAGNHGSPLGTTVTVNEPPDFQLIASVELTNATGIINCLENPPGTVLMPINIARTWEEHFTVQGWSTPQDQIDDGFPIFIQPTRDNARWEKIHDLGTTVNNVLIHLNYTKTDVVGTPDLVPKIAYSTDGTSYTEESDVIAVLAPAVRYIRVRLDYGTVP